MKDARNAGLLFALLSLAVGGAIAADAPPQIRGARISRQVESDGYGDIVVQYRVMGQLRMVKITPVKGTTYRQRLLTRGRRAVPYYGPAYYLTEGERFDSYKDERDR